MTEAWVLLLVFGIPLLAGACLAIVGQHRLAAELNVGFSFLTFAAATLLAVQTVAHGPAFALGKLFFVDPLSVKLSPDGEIIWTGLMPERVLVAGS